MRCGCRKKQAYCGPGCECQECQNLPVQNPGNVANEDNWTNVISENEESDGEETGPLVILIKLILKSLKKQTILLY